MNIRVRLVIDELARHRSQFEAFARSLSAEELATPIPGSHWMVRDYVAHLCTIDALIAAGFSPQVGLEAPPPEVAVPRPFDIDDWNGLAVQGRKDASVEELLEEAGKHRANMVAAIERMTDEHLDREIMYGGDRKATGLPPTRVRFGGLLWGIAIHEPTHTRDILRALPHRRAEPAIAEWMASVNHSLIPQGVREQRV
ncbi:MAG: DinB family protein [Dehalococcoidia bacterium]|nr:DinB family protein [Dehalococcoidia bacterium]